MENNWIQGWLQDLTKEDAVEKRADPDSFMVERQVSGWGVYSYDFLVLPITSYYS